MNDPKFVAISDKLPCSRQGLGERRLLPITALTEDSCEVVSGIMLFPNCLER